MLPKRKHIRLKHFDYGHTGAYYVTLCTHEKKKFLSIIDKETVNLTSFGKIVEEELEHTASIRPNISLGEFVIMPNHVHVILYFQDRMAEALKDVDNLPLRKFGGSHRGSLSSVVANLKAAITSRIKNEYRKGTLRIPTGAKIENLKIWQRGFYEHIIRDEKDLFRIIDYINSNPINWAIDEENPDRKP